MASTATVDTSAEATGAVYLRPPQVQDRYGVKVPHLAQLRYRGEGPAYIKRGRLILYRPADVESWLNGGLITPADSA